MTINQLLKKMESDMDVTIWARREKDYPLYEGASGDVPTELAKRKVTGIYPGYYFIGIDTD